MNKCVFHKVAARSAALATLVLAAAGCARQSVVTGAPVAPAAPAVEVAAPEPAEPHLGLAFEASPDGSLRVTGVSPGPVSIAGLRSADRIVAVDGERLDASVLRRRLENARPGDRVSFSIERADVAFEAHLTVARRADWRAPAEWPRALGDRSFATGEGPPWPAAIASELYAAWPGGAALDERLSNAFRTLAAEPDGFNKLPAVRVALDERAGLPAAASTVVAALDRLADEAIAGRPALAASSPALFCELLAVNCPRVAADAGERADGLTGFAQRLDAVRGLVERAFADVEVERGALAMLVEQTAAGHAIHAQEAGPRLLAVMRASMQVRYADLLEAYAGLLALGLAAPHADALASAADPLPPGIVEGDVRAHLTLADGWIVIGGPGANRYDMDRLHAVIDPGGDDEYVWQAPPRLFAQLVVDEAGDDRYRASHGGPGAAWLGVAVLIDRAGDDAYTSVFAGCGAGVLGFGTLLDGGGGDTYRCDAWSLGAGLYGGGLLLDLGTDGDVYASQTLSQGVGGPRGAGLLVDGGGPDLYRANGWVPSAYGTEAVYRAFSQGVGVGIRPLDHGGIGVLRDRGGDDRYEGGEFAQGGGYFWGLGVLADRAGDDLYYGNRYAQGFGAHQAAGLLSDDGGDDVYWSMGAAGQGVAWDQSVAVLHDGGGDDHYRASSLSQGAAAHQSRAWLYDAAGNDVYASREASAQGAAGANGYHLDPAAAPETAVFSLGVLVDGSGRDRYGSGLANGETRVREGLDHAAGGEGRAGVAMDRP